MADFLQTSLAKALPGLTITEKIVPFQQRLKDSANHQFDLVDTLWGGDYVESSTFLVQDKMTVASTMLLITLLIQKHQRFLISAMTLLVMPTIKLLNKCFMTNQASTLSTSVRLQPFKVLLSKASRSMLLDSFMTSRHCISNNKIKRLNSSSIFFVLY